MTDEQINIAIAKACGWDFDPIECAEWGSRQRWCKSPHGKIVFRHGIPDYCNDLNAMHEAEMTLKAEDCHAYGCYCSNLYEDYGNTVSLIARQRAEAFLKTIGKWID